MVPAQLMDAEPNEVNVLDEQGLTMLPVQLMNAEPRSALAAARSP